MQNSVDHIECSWNLSSWKCVHRVGIQFHQIRRRYERKEKTQSRDRESELKKKNNEVADQTPTNICVMIFNLTFFILLFLRIFVGYLPCRFPNWFLYAIICFRHLPFRQRFKDENMFYICEFFDETIATEHFFYLFYAWNFDFGHCSTSSKCIQAKSTSIKNITTYSRLDSQWTQRIAVWNKKYVWHFNKVSTCRFLIFQKKPKDYERSCDVKSVKN